MKPKTNLRRSVSVEAAWAEDHPSTYVLGADVLSELATSIDDARREIQRKPRQ